MNTKIQAVSFHNQQIAVLNYDNKPYIPIKPICQNIGLDWEAQRQRIKRNEILNSTAFMIKVVAKDGKNRQLLCLPLGYLNGWLAGIELNRVNPLIKPILKQYQLECFDVLYNHFIVKGKNRKHYLSSPQFTDDELCTLSWCYKAAERMRQQIKLVTKAMYHIKSDYAPAFYSMGIEYARTLENARLILDRETKHIDPNKQGHLSNNWVNVLPCIKTKQEFIF